VWKRVFCFGAILYTATESLPRQAWEGQAQESSTNDTFLQGYGARGNAALHNKSLTSNLDRALCPVNDQTSGIAGTYSGQH
jgi:hypothetical protein